METITWADFITPIIIGFAVAILVQFTKDIVQRYIKIATTGYTLGLCLITFVVWGFIGGWTWPGILFSSAIAYGGTQAFYLFGRGVIKA